jgi:hypothetical protein
MVTLTLVLLAFITGCGQKDSGRSFLDDPTYSTSGGTSATSAATSTFKTAPAREVRSELEGTWYFTDGSGVVLIEPGSSVSFIDPDGNLAGGPYQASDNGGSISLDLSGDEVAELFNDELGASSVRFVFSPGASAGELQMDLVVGDNRSSLTLVQSGRSVDTYDTTYDTEAPPDNPGSLDYQLEQVVARLVQGLLDARAALGYSPTIVDLIPGGPVEPYIPGGWPTNPMTGQPVRVLGIEETGERNPGDIFYMYFGGETRIAYWTSDGIQRYMHVDW